MRLDMVANACRPALRADDHDVGNVDRTFALRDAALDLLGRIRTRMALDHRNVLDQDAAEPRVHVQHAPGLAFVPSRDHLDGIVLPQLNPQGSRRPSGRSSGSPRHQITSGASDTIFINFLSLNSRATGPKTRVPTGSPTSLIKTAALESNRMYVPSLRRVSLRIRTITQRTSLPFFMLESGAASLTLAVTTSPSPARRPRSPPRGKIHDSLRAPLLSATSRIVRIPTISRSAPLPYSLPLLCHQRRGATGRKRYPVKPSCPDPSAAPPPERPAAALRPGATASIGSTGGIR